MLIELDIAEIRRVIVDNELGVQKKDIYVAVATEIFGVADFKVTPEQRDIAKKFVYRKMYDVK